MHVPLSDDLAVPEMFAHVQPFLARHDPQLRIRRSVERVDCYVLERRVRRRPATNTGLRDRSDIHVQARDGYLHVGLVHPSLMWRPWRIMQRLLTWGVDLWRVGVDQVDSELRYEEVWAEETRRRRRFNLFRDIATDHWHLLNRREGSRISSAGPAPKKFADFGA